MAREDSDLKLCHKLTNTHLTVSGTERQKVRLATELFSDSVANAILEYFPENSELSTFISTIDKFFDVFNSHSEIDKLKPLKSGFGINYNDQVAALQAGGAEG